MSTTYFNRSIGEAGYGAEELFYREGQMAI